jgi:indole-3-glycerol phosphate synthase
MSDFLEGMAKSSAARAANASSFTDADFDKPVVPLSLDRFGVIAEIKQRSPAEGPLNIGTGHPNTYSKGTGHLISRAQAYAAGGAAAISVLTEPSRFDGELMHLEEVAAAVPTTPVMRKDFLVEPVQVLEARKAGASGVLLITTMLDDAKLRAMLDCAWEHGMFVLLESFDEEDLERSARYLDGQGQLLIGVNTRNLRTLEVDGDRLQNYGPLLPQATCVAESGLHVPEDAARVAGWGYSMALVGTALMRSDDPARLVAEMTEAGAAVCS